MKITSFDKKDIWDSCCVYKILIKDGIKIIKLYTECSRVKLGKPYASWVITEYSNKKEISLAEYTEWGSDYGWNLLKQIEPQNDWSFELEPSDAYEYMNTIVAIDPKGCEYLSLFRIKDNTPCGTYYG